MKCNSYKYFFEKISNETRISIIELLQKKDLSVSEICSALKEEQSKVSHNLKCLSDCSIINFRKEGKKRIYSLNKETMIPLLNIVQQHVSKYCCTDCKYKK